MELSKCCLGQFVNSLFIYDAFVSNPEGVFGHVAVVEDNEYSRVNTAYRLQLELFKATRSHDETRLP